MHIKGINFVLLYSLVCVGPGRKPRYLFCFVFCFVLNGIGATLVHSKGQVSILSEILFRNMNFIPYVFERPLLKT